MKVPERKKSAIPRNAHPGPDIINDAEWSKLRRLSGLPDDARPDVTEVVSFLRDKPSTAHARASRWQRDKVVVEKAERKILRGLEGLDDLLNAGAVSYMVRPPELGPPSLRMRVSQREVTDLFEELAKIASMLAVARVAFPEGKGGRHQEHFSIAVSWLNEIMLKFTGSGLNHVRRKGSEVDQTKFVKEICKAGSFEMMDSSVMQKIKELRAAKNKA